jgi:hypothetical protein
MDNRVIGYGVIDLTDLVQIRDHWRALENAVTKLPVP